MERLESVTNVPNAIAHHTASMAEGKAINGRDEATRTGLPTARDVPT
jgi:hypothetical protein